MKKAIAGILLLVSTIAGCGQVQNELGAPGGFAGPIADDLLPAVTQRQQADRYLLAAMLIAPLALDLADDPEEALIVSRRVNALGESLANLYEAVQQCEVGLRVSSTQAGTVLRREAGDYCAAVSQISVSPANGYSFEILGAEVQARIAALVSDISRGLDIRIRASDVTALNPVKLARIWTRLRELFPVMRRSAANYRDGMVIFTDAIAHSPICTNSENDRIGDGMSATAVACRDLARHLNARYFEGRDTMVSENDLRQLFLAAERVARGRNWELGVAQYGPILAHINMACVRAEGVQTINTGSGAVSDEDRVSCSAAPKDGESNERGMLRLFAVLDAFSQSGDENTPPAGAGG